MNLTQISDLIKIKKHYENLSEEERDTVTNLFNTYKFLIFKSDKQIEDVNNLLKTIK